MRPIWAVVPALALLAIISLTIVPGAQAAIDSYGHVYLLDDGGEAVSESTEWRVYVQTPSGLHADAERWTFDVYAEYLGTGDEDADLVIAMTIDDGDSDVTETITIEARTEEGRQRDQIVIEAPSLAVTKDGTWEVSLTIDDNEVDTASGTCEIYASRETATIVAMMPMIVGLIVVVGIVGVLGRMLIKLEP